MSNKAQEGKSSKVSDRIWRFLGALPIILPASLAAFGVVVISLLVLGQLKSIIIWPLGLSAAFVVGVAVARHMPSDRPGTKMEQRLCDVMVIVGVVVWMIFGGLFAYQHLFTNRDPASYAITGVWLTGEEHLKIDRPQVLSDVPGVETYSSGFTRDVQDPDHLYARGPHLLPALLGLTGRIGGEELLFKVNVAFGALALLAMYGAARLLMRPRWALISIAALAFSLPLIYFSRDAYTEPLTLAFVFGALSLIWAAHKTGHTILWLLAGLTAGASALARIDAYLVILALVLSMAIFLILAKPRERRIRLKQTGWFLLSLALVSGLGWLDLALLSGRYYTSHLPYMLTELYLIIAIAVAGAIGIAISWRTKFLRFLDANTKRWRAHVAAIIVVLIALGVSSRPLWYMSYSPVGTRNYAELSANWLVWYIGLPITLLGVAGLSLVAFRVVKRANILFVASLLIMLIVSLVYLIRPNVAHDHIWASRRLLPVILPGIAIFAGIALDRLSQIRMYRIGVAVSVVGVLVLIPPLVTSAPFLSTRMYVPQLARIKDVCDALPDNAVVVWIGVARTQAVQPTRLFCEVPTAGYGKMFNDTDAPSDKTLAAIAKSADSSGLTPVIAMYGRSAESLGIDIDGMTEIHKSTSYDVEQTFDRPPQNVSAEETSILMGIVQPGGGIKPLPEAQ